MFKRMGLKSMFISLLLVQSVLLAASLGAQDAVIPMNTGEYSRHEKKIVLFPHKKHSNDYQIDCSACHHDEFGEGLTNLSHNDEVNKCIECHSTPSFGAGKSGEDELEYHVNTLHRLCLGCHKEYKPTQGKSPPVRCHNCHRYQDIVVPENLKKD